MGQKRKKKERKGGRVDWREGGLEQGRKGGKLNMYLFSRYLQHVCSATEGQKAGGYTSELACGRAMQEAFSALYLLDIND